MGPGVRSKRAEACVFRVPELGSTPTSPPPPPPHKHARHGAPPMPRRTCDARVQIKFVAAGDSNSGKPLLLLSNEVSSTVSAWEISNC